MKMKEEFVLQFISELCTTLRFLILKLDTVSLDSRVHIIRVLMNSLPVSLKTVSSLPSFKLSIKKGDVHLFFKVNAFSASDFKFNHCVFV